jgi:hypothetical protein
MAYSGISAARRRACVTAANRYPMQNPMKPQPSVIQLSMRPRLFVGRNGTIHYLNDRGGFRLIYAGGLVLLRKQFEECFMILNLTQLAGVLKGDCWNLSRRNSHCAQLRIAWVSFKLRKLITQ